MDARGMKSVLTFVWLNMRIGFVAFFVPLILLTRAAKWYGRESDKIKDRVGRPPAN